MKIPLHRRLLVLLILLPGSLHADSQRRRESKRTLLATGDVTNETADKGKWNPKKGIVIKVVNDIESGLPPLDGLSILAVENSSPGSETQTTSHENVTQPTNQSSHDDDDESDETMRMNSSCLFFNDHSYTCQTGCVDDPTVDPVITPFRSNKKKFYNVNNCSTNVNTNRKHWSQADGIIDKKIGQSNGRKEVVATCAFYQTMWFECYGITDCTEGIDHCRGGLPWRGSYEGTWSTGYKGKTTLTALNDGGGGENNSSSNNTGKTGCAARVAVNYCIITRELEGAVQVLNYQFVNIGCSSGLCHLDVLPVNDTSTPQLMRNKIGDVMRSMEMLQAMDMTTYCYFFDNGDFHCVFTKHPTNLDLSGIRCKFTDRCEESQC
ncbi:hypothetical protein BV898_16955 [Hypsibius exemplaris]|uniref:Uncharacterized protein n=1 Tax=Hypsibius exemplaris TaxID=2072580 RepID=A0A9X6RLJ8_HYPEX|nr:hypothetical protein BV898_16955 [Hypsibius exemplaris]